MNYIVLCNPEPIAAVVYGPSMFCRTNNPQMLGLYAVVAKNWQRQGIGMEFCRLAFVFHYYPKEHGICEGCVWTTCRTWVMRAFLLIHL